MADISPRADSQARMEELAYTKGTSIDERDKEADVQKKLDDIWLRRVVAMWSLGIVSVWMFYLMIVVSRLAGNRDHLSDAVVMALIGSTTVNVISISVVVVKSLFPPKDASAKAE